MPFTGNLNNHIDIANYKSYYLTSGMAGSLVLDLKYASGLLHVLLATYGSKTTYYYTINFATGTGTPYLMYSSVRMYAGTFSGTTLDSTGTFYQAYYAG